MKASKTENWFKAGFQHLKTGLPKELVLTALAVPCLKSLDVFSASQQT